MAFKEGGLIMKKMAAKELKNTDSLEKFKLRPMDTAWVNIENTLKRSKPKFEGFKDAMD